MLVGQKKAIAIQCLGTAEVVKTGGMASSRLKGPVIGPNHADVRCTARRARASAPHHGTATVTTNGPEP